MSANQFERKLRERMMQAEITPRPEVWDQVAGRIEPDDRRRGFFWLFFDWALGISLVLLFLLPFQSTELSTALAGVPAPTEIQIPPISNVPASTEAMSPQSDSGIAPSLVQPEISIHTKAAEIPAQVQEGFSHAQTPAIASEAASTAQQPQAEMVPGTQAVQHKLLGISTSPGLLETEVARVQSSSVPEAEVSMLPSQQELAVEVGTVATGTPVDKQPISLNRIATHPPLSVGTIQVPATVAPIPWKLKSHNKWAFRFFVRPERSTEIAFGITEDNAFSPVINNSRTAESNVVYGNYQPPNDETYYVVSHPQNSLTVGAHAEYFINRRLSVQSGISITSFELGNYEEGVVYSTDQITSGAGTPVSLDSVVAQGLTEGLNFDAASGSSYRSLMIAIPIQVNYYLKRGRSSWIVSGGISLAQEYTDGTSRQQNVQNGSIFSNTQISSFTARSLQSYITTKVLYERSISSRLGLYAGPSFQYRLNKGKTEGIPGTSPLRHRLGLEMGIRFNAGK